MSNHLKSALYTYDRQDEALEKTSRAVYVLQNDACGPIHEKRSHVLRRRARSTKSCGKILPCSKTEIRIQMKIVQSNRASPW